MQSNCPCRHLFGFNVSILSVPHPESNHKIEIHVPAPPLHRRIRFSPFPGNLEPAPHRSMRITPHPMPVFGMPYWKAFPTYQKPQSSSRDGHHSCRRRLELLPELRQQGGPSFPRGPAKRKTGHFSPVSPPLGRDPEKTKIVNVKRRYSDFLGFKIKVHPKGNKHVVQSHI